VEPNLKKEFKGATAYDVEFEFGKPDEIEDLDDGEYVYTYYTEPINKRNEKTYKKFLFDEGGRLRTLQSNQTVKQKKFNTRATVFSIIFWTTIFPLVIVGIASSSASD
jgi:hypothetical protein